MVNLGVLGQGHRAVSCHADPEDITGHGAAHNIIAYLRQGDRQVITGQPRDRIGDIQGVTTNHCGTRAVRTVVGSRRRQEGCGKAFAVRVEIRPDRLRILGHQRQVADVHGTDRDTRHVVLDVDDEQAVDGVVLEFRHWVAVKVCRCEHMGEVDAENGLRSLLAVTYLMRPLLIVSIGGIVNVVKCIGMIDGALQGKSEIAVGFHLQGEDRDTAFALISDQFGIRRHTVEMFGDFVVQILSTRLQALCTEHLIGRVRIH